MSTPRWRGLVGAVAAVASLAPIGLRGSAFGLLAAVQGFGNLAASAITGALWTALSGQAAFLYLAVWMLVSLVTLGRAIATCPRPGWCSSS